MTARDTESQLIAWCADAANASARSAVRDAREANVFRLAAMIIVPRFPAQAKRLMDLSNAYFVHHPGELMEGGEVVRRGWVASLPRFRQMLYEKLDTLQAA